MLVSMSEAAVMQSTLRHRLESFLSVGVGGVGGVGGDDNVNVEKIKSAIKQ